MVQLGDVRDLLEPLLELGNLRECYTIQAIGKNAKLTFLK